MQIVAEENPESDPDPRVPQAVKALTAKPRRLFLKAWDEWDHHSVVLEEGGVGLVKLGYKVAKEEDLVQFEKRVQAFGCTTERMSYHDNPAVGEGVRVQIPSGHTMELYHEIEFTDTAVGLINPALFPRYLTGVGVPRLDHALLKAEDIPLSERFFMEAMDFKPAERLVTDLSDDAELLGRSYGGWSECITGLSWGLADLWGLFSWLRGGEWDGGVDEVEGAALVWGGFGEHGDVGAGVGVADLVAGEGGEVVEQAAEAA